MPKFTGDVSAEQHALDNPGHIVMVRSRDAGALLDIACQSCDWWDEQLYKEGE